MNIATSTNSPAGLAGTAKSSSRPPAEAPHEEFASADRSVSPRGEVLSEQAAVHALVTSLKGDFQEMGIVPPPRTFAGVSLSTQPRDSEASSGTLATMRLLMVKGIISQLIGRNESAPPQADNQPQDTGGAEGTDASGPPHPVDMSL